MAQLGRIGLRPGIGGGGSGGGPSNPLNDPDAIAYVAALEGAPPTWQYTAINKAFVDLKAGTVWGKLRVLYTTLDQAAAPTTYVNAKSPGTFDGTPSGGITYIPNGSIQGDGIDGIIGTGFNPVAVGGMQNGMGAGVRVIEDPGETGVNVLGNSNTSLNPHSATDTIGSRVNNTTQRTATNTNTLGLFGAERTGSLATNHVNYRNGAALTTGAAGGSTSATPGNAEITFLGNVALTQYSNRKVNICYISAGFTAGEQSSFNSIMNSLVFETGITIALLGQSNMLNMTDESSAPPTPNAMTRMNAGAGWTAVTGNGAITLANALNDALGVPVSLLPFAVGSSPISDWQSGGSAWVAFTDALTAQEVDGFDAVLWYQGERDAFLGTSGPTYSAALADVEAQCAARSGMDDLPFGVVTIAHTAGTDAETEVIRQAALGYIDTNTSGNVSLAYSATDQFDVINGIHFSVTIYKLFGDRGALFLQAARGEIPFGAEGPALSTATGANGSADITLTVTHAGGAGLTDATGATTGTGLTGFTVTVDGSPGTISSTAFTGGNIVLTLDAPLSTGDVVTVNYQYGNPDTANPVYDDDAIPDQTLGRPLQPSRGGISVSGL